jgi:hypothetical protein
VNDPQPGSYGVVDLRGMRQGNARKSFLPLLSERGDLRRSRGHDGMSRQLP